MSGCFTPFTLTSDISVGSFVLIKPLKLVAIDDHVWMQCWVPKPLRRPAPGRRGRLLHRPRRQRGHLRQAVSGQADDDIIGLEMTAASCFNDIPSPLLLTSPGKAIRIPQHDHPGSAHHCVCQQGIQERHGD